MKGKRRELFGKCILFLKMVKKKSRPIGGNTFFEVERAMGIEPTSKAWEAFILPKKAVFVKGKARGILG